MSFPRYPKYKDSGVEWLGDVPEHWEVLSLRRCASNVQTGGTPSTEPPSPDLEHGLLWYTPGDFGDSLVLTTSTWKISPNVVARGEVKVFPPGTVLIVGIGATLGKVGFAEEASSANQQINAVIPNERIDGYFLAYSLLVKAEVMRFLSNASTIGIMNQEKTKDIWIAVPPIPEQTVIAAFLDRETAKIDELVGEQRRLIELLKEKRQAVISHAVTKGLNPHAPMKPSGIEWLGDVPEHWEVKPLKYSITKIEQGWSPQCESEPAAENEWGVLKVGCGNRDKFDPTEQKALPLDVAPMPNYEIKAGDILVSRGNTLELVGMATFIEKVRPRLLLCDLLYRFQAKSERAEGAFLVLSLRSPNVRFQIERDATGTSASMKKIGQGTIREFVLAIPPLEEQRAIITFVNAETAKLDILTAEAQRAIDLLQERRTALISAAVTGQIDVRP
jgi:type I restriction enzyme S subunit